LRQQQIREGWHRDDEPDPGPRPATDAQRALIVARAHLEFARDEAARASEWDQVADLDDAIAELESQITIDGMRGWPAPPHATQDQEDDDGKRRVRSTKRRQDAPDLPRLPLENRTVGHSSGTSASSRRVASTPRSCRPVVVLDRTHRTPSRRRRTPTAG
jgi:hypothetical protein